MLTIGEELTITFKGRTMTARLAGVDLSDGWVAFYIPVVLLREIVEEGKPPAITLTGEG